MTTEALRIRCHWQDSLLDVVHLRPNEQGVLDSRVGLAWSLAGRELGFVPPSLAVPLSLSPPLLSEVRSRPRGTFLVPADVLGLFDGHVAWRFRQGIPMAELPRAWDPVGLLHDEPVDLDVLAREGRAQVEGDRVTFLLTGGLAVRCTVGALTFDAALTTLPDPAPRPLMAWDTRALLASVLAATVLVAGLLSAATRSPVLTVSQDGGPPDVVATFLARVPPPPAPKVTPTTSTDGAPAAAEPGTAGASKATSREAKGAGKTPDDRTLVSQAGVLGAFASLGDVAGALGQGLSTDVRNGIGGLHGKVGTRVGAGGLGDRGDVVGGGADAEGLGGPGLRGPGHGDGVAFGTKRPTSEPVTPGEPVMMGGLPRHQVDAVVKRHLDAIRFCYQRRLQHDPTLQGKVTVKFTIAHDGSVSRAEASGSVADAAVGRCIEERFFGMRFPEPLGGGVVVVRYPFVFAPG